MKTFNFFLCATLIFVCIFLQTSVAQTNYYVTPAINLTNTSNSSGDGYYERDPSLLKSAGGTWYLIYSKSQTSFTHNNNPDDLKYDVYVKTSTNSGTTWSSETKVLDAVAIDVTSNFRNATIVEADGKIWVIGADVKALEGDIYANTYSGGGWSGQSMIFNGTLSTGAFHLDAIAEGDDIRLFYGVQQESKGTAFILYNGTTNSWDATCTYIGNTAGYQIPKVCKDGSTYFLVSTSWDYLKLTSTTTPSTVPWSSATNITTAPSGGASCDPSILKYNTNSLIVFHAPAYSDGSQPIEYVFSTNAGTSWSTSKAFTDAVHGANISWDMMPHAYLKDASTIILFFSMEQRGVNRGQGDIVVSEFAVSSIGNAHFTTIQDGIDNAIANDIVNVAAGTYAGNITVNKSLTLLGDSGDDSPGPGTNAPVVDGGGANADAFKISNGVTNVTIKGFVIQNFSSPGYNTIGSGIQAWVGSTSYITIQDNSFLNLGYNGILVGNDYNVNPAKWGDHTYWTVKKNIVSNCGYIGFELTNTSNSSIEDNEFHLNTPYIGAIFSSARRSETGLTVKNNTIDGTPSALFPVIYMYAYDLDMLNPNLNNVQILNNTVTTVGTPYQVYLRNIGTGTITNAQAHYNSISTFKNLTSAVIDVSCNWWGTTDPAVVMGKISGTVDFTPILNNGTDTNPTTMGFQPDMSLLTVHALGSQTGATGRIQEGVNLVSGSTVNVAAGTYPEMVTITKTVSLLGAQAGVDPRGGARTEGSASESIIDGGSTRTEGIYVKGTSDASRVRNIVIDGFEIHHATYTNVRFDFADSVTLKNTMVHHSTTNEGIKTRASCSSILVQKVTSHDNVGDGIELGDYGTHSNHVIEDCDFYNNADRGVYLYSTSNPIIRRIKSYGNLGTVSDWHQGGIIAYNNTNTTLIDVECYNNAGIGIYLYKDNYAGATSSSISGNSKCYSNTASNVPGDGLAIYLSHNITVDGLESYNNVRHGVSVGTVGQYGDLGGSELCNNITVKNTYVHNNTSAGMAFLGIGTSSCTASENNTISSNGAYGINNTSPSVIDAQHNSWGSLHGPQDNTGTLEVPRAPKPSVTDMKNAVPASNLGNAVSENVDYFPWIGPGHGNAKGIWAGGYVNPTSNDIFAGFDPTGLDGVDTLDIVAPPPPPSDYLYLYFLLAPGQPLENYSDDIKKEEASTATTAKHWDLKALTDHTDTLVTIEFPIAGLPSGFKPTLYELATGKYRNLRDIPYYEYTSPATETPSSFLVLIGDSTKPVVTVTAPNGGEFLVVGQPYNITWTSSDATGVLRHYIYYSLTGTAPYTLIDSTNGNVYSFNWTPGAASSGASIKVIARDSVMNEESDISNHTFQILATNSIAYNAAAGWNLVSPAMQQVDMTPAGVFGDDYGATPYYTFQYSPSGGYSVPSTLNMGQGYWLGSNSAQVIDAVGTPLSTANKALVSGFNIIGNPFAVSMLKDSLKFTVGSTTKNMVQAAVAGWLSNVLYGYSGGTYFVEGTTLGVWNGYWIPMLVDGITIQYTPTVGVPIPKNSPVFVEATPTDWGVDLNAKFVVDAQEYNDGIASFGVHKDATIGFDPLYDAARPPRSPMQEYVEVSFLVKGESYPKMYGNAYARDYKTSDKADWEFIVNTSREGTVTLTWDNSRIGKLPGDISIDLYDELDQKSINMKKMSSYTFEQQGTSRKFTVNKVTKVIPVSFELTQNYPNPFNPTTTITYGLPHDANVGIDVYDMMGRKMMTLVEGTKEAGYHEVMFDASQLASGMYIYRVTAMTLNGQHLSDSKKMMLLK